VEIISITPYPIEWVSKEYIRKIFNRQKIYEQGLSGDLQVELRKQSHLKNPPKGEPYCTHSQYLIYKTLSGQYVAGVHQYLRPDGTIGASGKPDPNRIVFNNKIYAFSIRRS
jgi:hypothetical protein